MADSSSPSLDPSSMSYRQLQVACKHAGLPAQGSTAVLKQNLQDFLNNPEETLERLKKEKKKKSKKKKKGWVDWRNHAAREILLQDLEFGGWLYGEDDKDVREIFDIYKSKQCKFEDVCFDQFQKRFKEATKDASKRRDRSAKEEEFLKHDRLLHPRKKYNHRGEPVFDMDIEAKQQLCSDIKNKLHKQMSPSELWEYREVYMKYK